MCKKYTLNEVSDMPIYVYTSIRDLYNLNMARYPDNNIYAAIQTVRLIYNFACNETDVKATIYVDKENNKLHVKYTYDGCKYKLIINTQKDPLKTFDILSVKDHAGFDITDKILRYYGPSQDLHLQNITPSMIGYESLVIEYLGCENESTIVVSKDSHVPINCK